MIRQEFQRNFLLGEAFPPGWHDLRSLAYHGLTRKNTAHLACVLFQTDQRQAIGGQGHCQFAIRQFLLDGWAYHRRLSQLD